MNGYLFHIVNDFEIEVNVDSFEVHLDVFQIEMRIKFKVMADALLFARDISSLFQTIEDDMFYALLWNRKINLSNYKRIIDYVREHDGKIMNVYPGEFEGFVYRVHGCISTLGFVEINCDCLDNPVVMEIEVPKLMKNKFVEFLENITALLAYIFMVE